LSSVTAVFGAPENVSIHAVGVTLEFVVVMVTGGALVRRMLAWAVVGVVAVARLAVAAAVAARIVGVIVGGTGVVSVSVAVVIVVIVVAGVAGGLVVRPIVGVRWPIVLLGGDGGVGDGLAHDDERSSVLKMFFFFEV
jgi:hypothetical protein